MQMCGLFTVTVDEGVTLYQWNGSLTDYMDYHTWKMSDYWVGPQVLAGSAEHQHLLGASHGMYMSFDHLDDPYPLFGSPYGLSSKGFVLGRKSRTISYCRQLLVR